MKKFTAVVQGKGSGISLMQAMRQAWPLLPEHALREALKRKDVIVSGRRVSGNCMVNSGEEIVLYTRHDQRDILVVYEDANYLLLNKPAGVNTDRNALSGFSLIGWAEERAAGSYQPYLCHRLDNQTSGLCLLAKDEPSAEVAKAAFKARDIVKMYECLVAETPEPQAAKLTAYLTKDAKKAKVFITDQPKSGALEITTGYRVLIPGDIARLEVQLFTGRTHQIRAHLAHIGHPVLGDDVYGNRSLNREKGQPGLKLCAVSLAFPPQCGLESLQGKMFTVSAPF
ncbi:MAG: RluA family pseudouridine synthase [Christensenellales bacterium]|jgi:23S rRNA pseudouridine955/2504/2580 synthase